MWLLHAGRIHDTTDCDRLCIHLRPIGKLHVPASCDSCDLYQCLQNFMAGTVRGRLKLWHACMPFTLGPPTAVLQGTEHDWRGVSVNSLGLASASSCCRLSLKVSLLRVTRNLGPKKREPLSRRNTSLGNSSLAAADFRSRTA